MDVLIFIFFNFIFLKWFLNQIFIYKLNLKRERKRERDDDDLLSNGQDLEGINRKDEKIDFVFFSFVIIFLDYVSGSKI